MLDTCLSKKCEKDEKESDDTMGEALREFMKPELEQALRQGRAEGGQEMLQLVKWLLVQKRFDEAMQIADDENLKNQLIEEFKASKQHL